MIESVMLKLIRESAKCQACFGALNNAQRVGPTQNPEEQLVDGQPRCYYRRAKTGRILKRVTVDPNDPTKLIGGPDSLVQATTIWVVQSTSYQWMQWAAQAIRLAINTPAAWNQTYTLKLDPTAPTADVLVRVVNMVLVDEQDTDIPPFPGEGLAPQERWLTFESQYYETLT